MEELKRTIDKMNKANFTMLKLCEEENEEYKRKIIEINAKIAECQNKKLELEERIKENVEYMDTFSKPWTEEKVKRINNEERRKK